MIGRVCAIALCLPVFAQPRGEQNPTFSTDVNVISVFATVHDAHGAVRRDLTKADFKLEEDGQEQTVRYFSQQSDLPLTLGLLVDTSASMLRVLGAERDASRQFLKQVLREKQDQGFLVHFDRQVELWQDLTSSRKKLDSGLGQLDPQTWFQKHMATSPATPGQHRGASTALYDALVLSSNQVMRKQSGRKAIILLSDGMDAGSQATLGQAIEAAERADTLVYTIHIYAEDPEMMLMGRADEKRQKALAQGKGVLERISEETGGGFFEVTKERPIVAIYQEIQDELRNQYSLGFTPDAAHDAAGFHNVKVSTTREGLAVQARTGYYVGP